MKFKEINPGMVIHCPKEEDKIALSQYLMTRDDLDFTCTGPKGEYGYFFYVSDIDGDPNDVMNNDITEFSNLIEPDEPQMSAMKILEWLHNVDADTIYKVFGISRLDEALAYYEVGEIIQKITAYEATKKAPKPVEVEFGWHCEIFDKEWNVLDEKEIWEGDEEHAKDEAAERAEQYVAENGETACYRVWGICRVKEDK